MELGRISLWNGETKERQAEEDLVNETIEHLVKWQGVPIKMTELLA